MFTMKVTPRFGDIDVLGHINNTVPCVWFEMGRTPLLGLFAPDFKIERNTFPLIIAHTDYDFTGQMYIHSDVEIKTWISRIGTKSFTVSHEAWQGDVLGVKGNVVIVYYDFNTSQTIPIPDDKRKLLEEHFIA